MLKGFEDDIRNTFQRHGVQDDKLENAIVELFEKYDRRVLSNDFIEKIEQQLDKRAIRRRRARGMN